MPFVVADKSSKVLSVATGNGNKKKKKKKKTE